VCTQLTSFEKDYTGTHGQQNIKNDLPFLVAVNGYMYKANKELQNKGKLIN